MIQHSSFQHPASNHRPMFSFGPSTGSGPGDLDVPPRTHRGEGVAQPIVRVAEIGAAVGGEADAVDAQVAAGEDGPRQMKPLRDQHRLRDAEDRGGAIAGVIGAPARVIARHIAGGDAAAHGVVVHAARLVVVGEAVVAADQQLAHFAGLVERDGRVHPILQHGAEAAIGPDAGAEDDGDRPFRRGGDIGQHLAVVAPLDPAPDGEQRADAEHDGNGCKKKEATNTHDESTNGESANSG